VIRKALRRYKQDSVNAIHYCAPRWGDTLLCGMPSFHPDRYIKRTAGNRAVSCVACCARICSSCGWIDKDHGPEGKCLFGPTYFAAIGAKKDVEGS
jgi:hypothetical protein